MRTYKKKSKDSPSKFMLNVLKITLAKRNNNKLKRIKSKHKQDLKSSMSCSISLREVHYSHPKKDPSYHQYFLAVII